MGDTPGGANIGMDEEAVAATSRKIAGAAEDVRALHTSTRAMLDDSGSGHVGSSAQALSELSRRWAETGRRHTQHIDTLGHGIGDAGHALSNTNDEGARQISQIPDY